MILQKKFSETDFIKMLQFLIDSIFTLFGGVVFNRHSIFLTVFLFSPIYSFIRMRQTLYKDLLKKNEKKLARSFNFKFRYSVYTDIQLILGLASIPSSLK